MLFVYFILSGNYCALSGLTRLTALVLPIFLIIMTNIFLFVGIVRENVLLCKRKRITKIKTTDKLKNKRIFMMILYFSSTGLSGLFGILSDFYFENANTSTVFIVLFATFEFFEAIILFIYLLTLSFKLI